MQDKDNQIHISIEMLELILKEAKYQKEIARKNSTDVIRITKTASRQYPELEDKIQTELLLCVEHPIHSDLHEG